MHVTSKEFKKILLDTHNEYKTHSARWGRKKELEAICERTGIDKNAAKKALFDMEHPYGMEMYRYSDTPTIRKPKKEKVSLVGTLFNLHILYKILK